MRLLTLLAVAACTLPGAFSEEHVAEAAVPVVETLTDGDAPAEQPKEQPYHLPLGSCGLQVADMLVCHPVLSLARGARTYFRAFIQTLRDLLFAQAVRSRSSPLDKVLEDEGVYDFERRMAISASLMAQAQSYGLVTFAQEQPTTFRYSAAVAVGVLMLATLVGMQMFGTLVAKGLAWALLKITGNPVFEDTPLLGPRSAMDLTPAEEHEQRRWKMEEEEEEQDKKSDGKAEQKQKQEPKKEKKEGSDGLRHRGTTSSAAQ